MDSPFLVIPWVVYIQRFPMCSYKKFLIIAIQVLQDYHKSHIEVTVGPPRPLITGERYQELEDRLISGSFQHFFQLLF